MLHSDGCLFLFSTPWECSKENRYERKLESETYILLPSEAGVQLGETNRENYVVIKRILASGQRHLGMGCVPLHGTECSLSVHLREKSMIWRLNQDDEEMGLLGSSPQSGQSFLREVVRHGNI